MGQATRKAQDVDRSQRLERRSTTAPRWVEPPTEQPTFLGGLRNELERLFDDFGMGQGFTGPSWDRFGAPDSDWAPETEVFERGGNLIVRADLPGMKKEDIDIDIDNGRIILRGERKTEHEGNKEGLYRSERSYGTFCRAIRLPETADADAATASFKDGVLEISMPLPQQEPRGRKLSIE